jgi:hypothetical protein
MSTPSPFFSFPIVITETGLQPQSPASLLSQLTAAVTAQVPDFTNNLPGTLIEDISSTDVAAIALCDQARVELVNSLTPLGANIFLLQQLAQIYLGQSQPGAASNTSVQVVFTGNSSAVGYVIPNGLILTDGNYAYQVQVGGVIQSGTFQSQPITAIAMTAGTFGVAANTVTTIQSSVPTGLGLTVTNPSAGTPGGTVETWYAFRQRVIQAGLAVCVSAPQFIKTMLGAILGAQSNLISVQQASGGLRIVVGGSYNSYLIAYAIFSAVGNPGLLVGSAINSGRNVTVSLNNYPDNYNIEFVAAPVQVITMTITWNTVLSSFTGGAAFPSLVQAPLAAYINSLGIGQPINVLEMNEIFQQAVESSLDSSLLTRLVFAVSINGTPTSPGAGTYAVSGDPESSFSCLTTGITVVQG